MAPVTESKRKGFLLSLAEGGGKVMSKMLNTKHAGVTKNKTRKGEAKREHGLRRTINRGVKAAMGAAYGLAKKHGVLGEVQEILADALVNTTGALLGIKSKSDRHMRTPIAGGWNIEPGAVQEADCHCLSVRYTKTPEGGEGRIFKTRLEFLSPSDDFLRVPAIVDHRQEEGTHGTHRHGRNQSCSRSSANHDISSLVSPGASAAGPTVAAPRAHPPTTRFLPLGYYYKPKPQPGISPVFDISTPLSPQPQPGISPVFDISTPLSPQSTLLNSTPIKVESIKCEVP